MLRDVVYEMLVFFSFTRTDFDTYNATNSIAYYRAHNVMCTFKFEKYNLI